MLEGATWGLLSNGTADERKQGRPVMEARITGIVKAIADRYEALLPSAEAACCRAAAKDRIIIG